MTKRSFIKKTGGATVATLVAWNLTASNARAESDVKVAIPSLELGLDKYGYRSAYQKKVGDQYQWKHSVPHVPNNGQTLPHDLPENESSPPPNQLTVTAVASPPAAITFAIIGSEAGCVQLLSTTSEGEGVYKLKLRAMQPSTPGPDGKRRKGGTVIAAYEGTRLAGKSDIYVLKPKKVKTGAPMGIIRNLKLTASKPGRTSYAPYEGQPVRWTLSENQNPQAKYNDEKSYFQDITMEVFDQFGQPLKENLYGGTGCEEDGQWIAWSAGPYYYDPVGVGSLNIVTIEVNQPHGFMITVAGHEVGEIDRILTITNDNGTNADYKLIWGPDSEE